MKKLFWGFFFIYLNFNLNFNQHSLNVLPDFVGYILLLQGARILEDESEFFSRARPFATGMTIYSAILWIKHYWVWRRKQTGSLRFWESFL